MIAREWQKVDIITYSDDIDAYGQRKTGAYTTRQIDMVCHVAQKSNQLNPKYVDVTMVGLTKDIAITDADIVVIDGQRYVIKYIVNSPRSMIQVMMGNE